MINDDYDLSAINDGFHIIKLTSFVQDSNSFVLLSNIP